jgi:tRNA-dihydrouridine synthase B
VLVGRGAVGNPWIFREARSLLEDGIDLPRPSRDEVIALSVEHLRRAVARKGLPRGLHEMRKTLAAYVRGFPNAARLRPMIFQEPEWERVIDLLEEYRRSLGDAASEPVGSLSGAAA